MELGSRGSLDSTVVSHSTEAVSSGHAGSCSERPPVGTATETHVARGHLSGRLQRLMHQRQSPQHLPHPGDFCFHAWLPVALEREEVFEKSSCFLLSSFPQNRCWKGLVPSEHISPNKTCDWNRSRKSVAPAALGHVPGEHVPLDMVPGASPGDHLGASTAVDGGRVFWPLRGHGHPGGEEPWVSEGLAPAPAHPRPGASCPCSASLGSHLGLTGSPALGTCFSGLEAA